MSYIDTPSDSKISYLTLGILGCITMLFIGLVVNQPEPTVKLVIKDWRCVTHHEVESNTTIFIDGIYMKIPGKKNVCDHWIRRL